MINLLVGLAILLFTPQTQTLTIRQTEDVLKVSVLIRAKQYTTHPKTKEIQKGLVGCSGTYISPHTVLTAAHCFSLPSTDIWVRGPSGPSSPAVVVKISPEHDLALLYVRDRQAHPYAKLAVAVRRGESVTNIGSPAMFEFFVSEGTVALMNQQIKPYQSKYLVTTAVIGSGSSGGGAFNSDGDLVGVNTMMVGFFGWNGISLAVSIEDIRRFLNAAN